MRRDSEHTIGPRHSRWARHWARRTEGVRTRILIIDDDRRSPVRLHRLEPGAAAAGKLKRNGRAAAAGANGSADHAVLALPEHDGDPGARGAVLDMDAALVRDVLARVQELLAQAEPESASGEEPESGPAGPFGSRRPSSGCSSPWSAGGARSCRGRTCGGKSGPTGRRSRFA